MNTIEAGGAGPARRRPVIERGTVVIISLDTHPFSLCLAHAIGDVGGCRGVVIEAEPHACGPLIVWLGPAEGAWEFYRHEVRPAHAEPLDAVAILGGFQARGHKLGPEAGTGFLDVTSTHGHQCEACDGWVWLERILEADGTPGRLIDVHPDAKLTAGPCIAVTRQLALDLGMAPQRQPARRPARTRAR